jgi:putative ABC transport system ATP-binding protein
VIALFRRLNEEQHITVILVTHDHQVARHARRAILLRDGRIFADTNDIDAALHSLHSTADEPEASPENARDASSSG